MTVLSRSCMDCRFADWKRTSAGHLHPSGNGRCRWELPQVVLPKAHYWPNGSSQPAGGYIGRHEPYYDCPTWEAKP